MSEHTHVMDSIDTVTYERSLIGDGVDMSRIERCTCGSIRLVVNHYHRRADDLFVISQNAGEWSEH